MSSTVTKENLDERIERIRKRNEELEKKHREAEEDRLMALKDNAMVKTKMPTDNDWPKGHRYDTLDFTYDQKDAPLTPSDSGDDSIKSLGRKMEKTIPKDGKQGRDYKKFADGEGPPPDPSYNFLADAERDGTIDKSTADKKDWRQPNNGNGGNANTRNRGGLNNSFRGRINKPRNSNGNNSGGMNGGGGSNIRYHKHDSNNEFNAWKNERERIDEARIGRQKIGDGKWRREWDSEKLNDDETIVKIEKININDAYHGGQQQSQKSPNHHQSPHDNRNGSISSGPRTAAVELPMEKRGNIMVSVSQDGEVKSVKLQSARAIGTGRVGLRQTPNKNPFSGQKDVYPPGNHFQQQQQQQQLQPQQQQLQLLQQQHQPLPHHYQLQPDHQQNQTQYYEAEIAPIVPRPFFDGRPNLQDRLQRHRQPAQPTPIDNVYDGSTNDAPIAVGY